MRGVVGGRIASTTVWEVFQPIDDVRMGLATNGYRLTLDQLKCVDTLNLDSVEDCQPGKEEKPLNKPDVEHSKQENASFD